MCDITCCRRLGGYLVDIEYRSRTNQAEWNCICDVYVRVRGRPKFNPKPKPMIYSLNLSKQLVSSMGNFSELRNKSLFFTV